MMDNPQVIVGTIIGLSLIVGTVIAFLTIPVIDILIIRKKMKRKDYQ